MQPWVPIAVTLFSFICQFGLAMYVFMSNRQAAKDKELQEANRRLGVLEEQMKNVPDHEDMTKMSGDIRSLQTEVQGLGKMLESVEKTVTRIQDYLLTNRG